jgi:hypothetical protein
MMTISSATGALTLDAALGETRLDGGYVAATATQMKRAESCFERLMRGERSQSLTKAFGTIGFVLGEVAAGRDSVTLVREAPDRREGKGMYVVRAGGTPALLQAPHRYKDIGTGDIQARLMEAQDFRAAAWNTCPRWYEESGVRIDSDLAHVATSHFNAFGLAFARTCPSGRVVQVHGFERDNRSTAAGRSASAIISAGTEEPTLRARRLASRLASDLAPENVLLYPEQVKELGGTRNKNGEALRAIGFHGFVHLELSRELRDRLLGEPAALRILAECIARG